MKLQMLACFTAALLLSACKGQNDDDGATPAALMKVSVVRAQAVEFSPVLRLGGNWVARDEIAITPALQGQQILSVAAEVGTAVRKGQVLAVLEPENVQSQLRQNSAQLNRAKANLAAQQASLQEAQSLFKSHQSLVGSGAVSKQDFNQQKAKVQSAKAAVQAARAEIAQIQAQVDDSQHQRHKAEIVAPADGIITRRNAEAGALSSAEALFFLAKDGVSELEAEVHAEQLAQLQAGLAAQLALAGESAPLAGKIRLVYPAIDSKSRLGKVRIAFARTPLPIGAYSEVQVVLGKRQIARAVPFSAVEFGSDGVKRVKIVNAKGEVEEREVQTGVQHQQWIEVLSGLEDGAQIVKQAAAFVGAGDHVAPQLVQE